MFLFAQNDQKTYDHIILWKEKVIIQDDDEDAFSCFYYMQIKALRIDRIQLLLTE